MKNPHQRALSLDFPLGLIQGIRLAHALMETDYLISVPPEYASAFSILKDRFGISYLISNKGEATLPASILHHEPRTSIGAIERALVFPHGIATLCRSWWPANRSLWCSFAGIVTDRRRDVINRWLENVFHQQHIRLPREGVGDRRTFRATGPLGTAELWESHRGRTWPLKAWDEEYVRLLAESQMVLCPSGDFAWTYRFFEAALCGAVPVIEEPVTIYEGFRYRTMSDPAGSLIWSSEDVEHNYQLCLERLTVPKSELSREIAKFLTAP